MVPFGSGYPGFTPYSDDEDECEGLTEQECNDIRNAVDVSLVMASLDCSYEDMSEVIDMLAELFDGERTVIDYTCFNGNRIRIEVNGDGSLSIETDPPLDEILGELDEV